MEARQKALQLRVDSCQEVIDHISQRLSPRR